MSDPTDVPALLAEVERLRGELSKQWLSAGPALFEQTMDALLARAEKAEADLAAAREAKWEIEQQFRELQSESRILPCDAVCIDAPEEDCSRHGREPADLWRIIAEVQAQRDEAREALARVETLADEWACDDPGCDREGGDFIRAALQPATDEGAGA